jgi:hypothetical protein
MVQVVTIIQGLCDGLSDATGRRGIEPIRGLNIVLSAVWMGAARVFEAQTIKEVVGRSVFLENYNNVLELCDLRLGGYRCQGYKEFEENPGIEFHVATLYGP